MATARTQVTLTADECVDNGPLQLARASERLRQVDMPEAARGVRGWRRGILKFPLSWQAALRGRQGTRCISAALRGSVWGKGEEKDMPDRPSPMTAGERAERNAERRALSATDLQITFAPPIVPPAPGVRVFPPPVTGTLAERPDRTFVREEISRFEAEYGQQHADFDDLQRHNLDSAAAGRLREVLDREEAGTHGYLPDHLPLNPLRPAMDERLRARRFFDPDSHLEAGQYEVTTIFPPDQRLVFSDTSFPWCTTGRVATAGGWG